jgi:hypothetical protein
MQSACHVLPRLSWHIVVVAVIRRVRRCRFRSTPPSRWASGWRGTLSGAGLGGAGTSRRRQAIAEGLLLGLASDEYGPRRRTPDPPMPRSSEAIAVEAQLAVMVVEASQCM